jgi:hypothetical protein
MLNIQTKSSVQLGLFKFYGPNTTVKCVRVSSNTVSWWFCLHVHFLWRCRPTCSRYCQQATVPGLLSSGLSHRLILQVVTTLWRKHRHNLQALLQNTLNMEAIRSSQTMVTTCKTTRRHNPGDHIPQFHVVKTSNLIVFNSRPYIDNIITTITRPSAVQWNTPLRAAAKWRAYAIIYSNS